MPCDFDMWNTHEKIFSQSPRKAFQEMLMLVYLVFKCYWWQICYTQLSKPSPKLRSWAPLLVYDATVTLTNIPLIPITKKNWGWINWEWFLKKILCLFNWIDWWWFHFRWRIPVTHPRSGKGSKRGTLWRMKTNKMVFMR